jgi:predicted signal transduction protein with EAL and GGDEF domain
MIRCACARSFARWNARAFCRCCWWPSRADEELVAAPWISASTTTSCGRSTRTSCSPASLTQIKRKRYNDRLRRQRAQTIELAVTDGLTGLYNRRYLDNHHEASWSTARWLAGVRCPSASPISTASSSVNDTYGHDAGDEVLRELRGTHPPDRSRR